MSLPQLDGPPGGGPGTQQAGGNSYGNYSTPAQRIMERAPRPFKRTGHNQYLGHCWAHDDNHESLAICDKGDRALLFCHAGCSPDDILAAIGLTVSDLFDKPGKHYQKPVKRAERPANNVEALKLEEAARKAAFIWNNTEPVEHFPYLTRKQIDPHGTRIYKGALVVPVRFRSGRIRSLQFIDPDGNKRFLSGGATRGGYFAIGEPIGRLFIAEGLATAGSIHQATGQAVAVAFNAGNLKPVAEVLRSKFPELEIVIAADRDAAGLKGAKDAAESTGAQITAPEREGQDFNDTHTVDGLAAVARQTRRRLVR